MPQSDMFSSLEFELIDEQHFELVKKGEELIKLIEKNEEKEKVLYSYDDLISSIRYHFKTEEELFNSFDYEESYRHKKMHNFLLDFLMEYRENYAEHNMPISSYAITFLREWVKAHVSSFDLNFVKEYKKAKGIL
ncbi:MAG: hemerythrin family protein [Fusobacteriaceae bacterium]|nr:hemerythrin family protein [Fusobacteriaceae bacterium]